MGLTYVIPDIHGRYDLLCDGLTDILAHASGEPGIIITIGDYVDKGPASKQVIDRMLAGVADGWRLIALKGNHEAMMAQALRDSSRMDVWIAKGGDTALASYGGDPVDVPQSHVAWLDALQLMHVDNHRVYVHAGVDPELPLDQQSEAILLSKRYPKGYPGGFGRFHVVHGHDNFPAGPLLYEGRTNLDTLAWRTGRLVIGVFDDDTPGGPVDFIVVRRAPASGVTVFG